MRRAISILGLILVGLTSPPLTLAVPSAPGDYNGDGLSDLAVTLTDRESSLTAWLVRLSAQSDNYLFWTFNVPGDAMVTGSWYGDSKVYPGVVWVRDARRPLEWYLKNPQGGETFLNYGLPGDGVPNQGDLDCDGVTDFLVTRNGTSAYFPGYKLWYMALSSQAGQVREEVFGLQDDITGVADLDGDRCAELIALRAGFNWFGKKINRPEISQVQWGLPGDYPVFPYDMNSDGQADYIIARATGTGQQFYVRYSSESYDVIPGGFDTAVPMAGNFNGTPGLAWLQRDLGGAAIRDPLGILDLFPFGIADNAVVRPDGTVVQPNDSGRFGTPSVPGGGGGGGVGVLHCDRELDMSDGRGNNKYRPSSSKGRKMLWETDLLFQIEAAASFSQDGTKVEDWSVYGTPEPSGPRTRAYSTKSPSAMPKPEILVAQLRDGTTACAVIPDPTKTWD